MTTEEQDEVRKERRWRKAIRKRIRAEIRNDHPHRRGLEGMTLREYLLIRYDCDLKAFAGITHRSPL